MSDQIRQGRLKQVDENPELVQDYIRAWGRFPELKEAGLWQTNISCEIRFFGGRLASALYAPSRRNSLRKTRSARCRILN